MLTYASFFAGAGGLDLGASNAGLAPRLVTDIDYDCICTVREGLNFPPKCPFIQMDMKELLWQGILRDVIGRRQVDVVIGGPPCQGFSVAGRMDPEDPRSELVFAFMRGIDQLRPTAFLMENVAALASKKWSLILERLRIMAQIMGYDTYVMVLNAVNYGVAQDRSRMFLFGVPKGVKVTRPEAHHYVSPVRHVIEDMPVDDPDDVYPTAKITLAKNPILRKSWTAGLLVNGGGRVIDIDKPAPTLPATMGGNRTPIIDLDQLEHGREPWMKGYHADLMDGERPLDKVPEYVRMRRLSMNECAALQTFPSRYPFAGKPSSRWRQIGNAVPPWLGSVAVRTLMEGLR